MNQSKLVLAMGATGSIGGRLVPHLLKAGYQVRSLVGDAKRLQGSTWIDQVEVVEGDALKPKMLAPAMFHHLRSRQETGAALAETERAETRQAQDTLAALAA